MVISKHKMCSFIIVLFCIIHFNNILGDNLEFPNEFIFGIASSAYQTEGAHNINGKGENIWDHYLAHNPDLVTDRTNGNIACDSYHKINDDLKLLDDLGVQFYRFSISWSRILPSGQANQINEDGIRYYNQLIDGLLERNIQPMVTMYHWDLPMKLQQFGGWTNEIMVTYFEDYAKILFDRFGNRVKFWITFNSNTVGHGDGEAPPLIDQSGIAEYMFIKNILLAHARVYHLYNKNFRELQDGKVGITIDGRWFEPATPKDEDVAERVRQFNVGIYAHPILKGDFPEVVKTRIGNLSIQEGFPRSRLPQFSQEQIRLLKGSYDFLGINIYTTFLTQENIITTAEPSYAKDLGARYLQDPSWGKSRSQWLRVVPWGLRKVLNWIKEQYDNPVVYVTENGVSDEGNLKDNNRINFYQEYLKALLEAIHLDKVNVKGYAAWSLLDNFEWTVGYTERFGLHYVDFDDPNRTRKAKLSAKWYKQVIAQKKLPTVSDELWKEEL